jgi:hypothetical protein
MRITASHLTVPLLVLAALSALFAACGSLPDQTPGVTPTVPPASTVPPNSTAGPSPAPSSPALPPPTAAPACTDQASFVADVTVPNDTVVSPGQVFIKTWRLRNSGTCIWTEDYALVFAHGDAMGASAAVPLPYAVAPGSAADLSVTLVAPAGSGTYAGHWQLRNAAGSPFGIAESADGTFLVQIVVQVPVVAPTPTPISSVPPTPTPTPPAPPTPTPIPIITEWRGEYYGNVDLSGTPALVRNDTAIDFDWGTGSPAAGLPADNFSVRWTRTLDFAEGTYRFRAMVDDGVRLYVDNKLILDSWHDGAAREETADCDLAQGPHSLRIEYYERAGDARIQASWDKVESYYPDWKGEYFASMDLSGSPKIVRNDVTIDFNWGTGPAAPGLPADRFSVRWERWVNFGPGLYVFYAQADNGMRAYLDGRLVIDAWSSNGKDIYSHDEALSGSHHLVVEYFDNAGNALARFWWVLPSMPPAPRPTLTPTPAPTVLPTVPPAPTPVPPVPLPPIPPVPGPIYPDWKGEYFASMDLSGSPKIVRNDVTIDFNWGTGPAAPGLPADRFSVRWERWVNFGPGLYVFYAQADNGMRAYLDGRLVIDAWSSNGKDIYSHDEALSGSHHLVVEYFDNAGNALARFWWLRAGAARGGAR